MNLMKRGDMIVDKYGNYYYVIDQKGETLRLINALLDLSLRRKLDAPYIDMHQGERVGDHALELLKGHVDMIANRKSRFRFIPIEELEADYELIFVSIYDL
ncbi:hypothetical protein ACFO4N_08850 [Camelliibacillus cellulosilyticus]|uniref:Uncharacterized protein n=1 Tax=Camelliibacillus cellulosilyticus TaxID=2174486 RepID=A0ABV9GQC0_9BACL